MVFRHLASASSQLKTQFATVKSPFHCLSHGRFHFHWPFFCFWISPLHSPLRLVFLCQSHHHHHVHLLRNWFEFCVWHWHWHWHFAFQSCFDCCFCFWFCFCFCFCLSKSLTKPHVEMAWQSHGTLVSGPCRASALHFEPEWLRIHAPRPTKTV